MSKFGTDEMKVMGTCLQYAKNNGISKINLAFTLAPMFDMPVTTVKRKLYNMDIVEVDEPKVEYEWDDVEDRLEQAVESFCEEEEDKTLEVGDIVAAEVVKVMSYGALCIPDGTDETILLHISKVARRFVDDMTKEIKLGQYVTGTIISGKDGRLGLSLIEGNTYA